ncbi:hypothetical protein [Dactylosporangium darangshiense]|uniref:Uncharacterized protein n=1 Tax=Dactylosporangium darangshiense TaxID=579108 RepID=A0ABP8DPA9_9ACTN
MQLAVLAALIVAVNRPVVRGAFPPVPDPRPRNCRAALLLAVLAPVVAEVTLGTVPLRLAWAWLVFAPVYSAGAVFVREVVRRTGRGYPSLLLMGIALLRVAVPPGEDPGYNMALPAVLGVAAAIAVLAVVALRVRVRPARPAAPPRPAVLGAAGRPPHVGGVHRGTRGALGLRPGRQRRQPAGPRLPGHGRRPHGPCRGPVRPAAAAGRTGLEDVISSRM